MHRDAAIGVYYVTNFCRQCLVADACRQLYFGAWLDGKKIAAPRPAMRRPMPLSLESSGLRSSM